MRQVRLDHHPGFVTQPEEIVHGRLHERPPASLNQKQPIRSNR
jgi:hypothetical protein